MKFRHPQHLKLRVGIDMTPLINCVLLLLLFFMLSSSFTVQNTISIAMPVAEGTPVFEDKDISITLAFGTGGPGGRGPVYVNEKAVESAEDLTRILNELHVTKPDVLVLIRADARVESARLIETLGLVKSIGFERCGIAAQAAGAAETAEPSEASHGQ